MFRSLEFCVVDGLCSTLFSLFRNRATPSKETFRKF